MAVVSRSRPNVRLLAGLAVLLAVAAVAATRPGPAARQAIPAIAAEGDVYQSGAAVGRASGAKISRADASIVEFDQISAAARLNYTDEFQYAGHVLRVTRVRLVDYPSTLPAQRPQPTLLQVEARIQRRGELVRLDKPRAP
jgi:hypothetical protein